MDSDVARVSARGWQSSSATVSVTNTANGTDQRSISPMYMHIAEKFTLWKGCVPLLWPPLSVIYHIHVVYTCGDRKSAFALM